MKTPSHPKTPKTSSKPSKPKPHSSKVRVVVNVRPFLPPESPLNSDPPISCVFLDPQHGLSDEVVVNLRDQFSSRKEWFKLDAFFGGDGSVGEIFEKEVRVLIGEMFRGCNGTVFACGATGSGKTHMMQGPDERSGLMSMSMSMVLNMCESSGSTAEISYYEVYMGKCYDLLEPKEQEILVLDDKDGQVHLRGLSRVPVSSMSEFQQVLSSGIGRRKVAHTYINDISSRSHGVLVIAVSSKAENGFGPVVLGKMNLIDLAGNEDNGRTGNERLRLQESAKINQSLFSLSNVIHALNNNQLRVPYRESKLTRILQDSLGGNSHALMIACLNPGEYQESVYTVSLASRSRQITNCISSAQKEETPKEKVDMEAKLREWMESKGMKRSAQKVLPFGSPRPNETPLSTTRSTKKQSSCQSYAKVNNTVGKGSASTKRNLFQLGAPVELKEKMKNTSRVIAFGSPCPSKTPLSTSRSIKKESASQSHAKVNNMTESKQDLANAMRNSFRLAAPAESKGKIKSTHRVIAFGSPCPRKTPLSTTRSIKKQSALQSHAKVNNTNESNQDLVNATRNLFTSGTAIDSSVEGGEEHRDLLTTMQLDAAKVSNDESCGDRFPSPYKDQSEAINGVEEYRDLSSAAHLEGAEVPNKGCENRVTSPYKDQLKTINVDEEYEDSFTQQDGTKVCKDESCEDRVASLYYDYMKESNIIGEECKDSFTHLDGTENCKDESCEDTVDSPYKDQVKTSNIVGIDSKDFKGNTTITDETCVVELKTPLPDELLKKENLTCTPSKDFKGHTTITDVTCIAELKAPLPDELLKKENLTCTPINASVGAASGMVGAIQNSLRKVLSPITNNAYIQSHENMKSNMSVNSKTPKTPFNGEDMTSNMSFDPKTPKTPFNGNELHGIRTPLDKYNLRSSNLKSSLAQEYVEFLNSASKEELLKLKGIGQKRAEYILQLRETSPLESLYDLEKIGLSAKQVDSVFKKAARGIFE